MTKTKKTNWTRRVALSLAAPLLVVLAGAVLIVALALAGGPKAGTPSMTAAKLEASALAKGAASSARPTLDAEALRDLAASAVLPALPENITLTKLELGTAENALSWDAAFRVAAGEGLPLPLGIRLRGRVSVRYLDGRLFAELESLRLGALPIPKAVLGSILARAAAQADLPEGLSLDGPVLRADAKVILARLGSPFELRELSLSPAGATVSLALDPAARRAALRRLGAAATALAAKGGALRQLGPGAAAFAAELEGAAPALADMGTGRIVGSFVWVEGSVVLRSPGGAPVEAELGRLARRGDILSTGEKSRAELRLGNGSALMLGPSTTVTLTELGSEDPGKETRTVALASGALRSRVAKLTGSGSFEVRTGGAIAGVRGTDFVVAVLESSEVSCSVLDGSVLMRAPSGASAAVGAGERNLWRSGAGFTPNRALEAAETAALEAELGFRSAQDPLSVPEDLLSRLLRLAAVWAERWDAMSPEEQEGAERELGNIPEVAAFARELGIDY